MSEQRYITVPNWTGPTGFQHYKDRDPKWIKNYTRLLMKDEYRKLTFKQRGLLHGIWLAFASSGGKLGASPAQLGRILGEETVRTRDIEALNHAGFIEFLASGALAELERNASLENIDLKREEKSLTLTRTPSEATMFLLHTAMAGGTIRDRAELDARLAHHPELSEAQVAELRALRPVETEAVA